MAAPSSGGFPHAASSNIEGDKQDMPSLLRSIGVLIDNSPRSNAVSIRMLGPTIRDGPSGAAFGDIPAGDASMLSLSGGIWLGVVKFGVTSPSVAARAICATKEA